VTDLPPELLRKGRFDEIFFVDLPGKRTRKQIFAVHVKKRGHALHANHLNELADLTDGFSGAEIEACVSEGLYNWANQGLTTQSLPPFGPAHIIEAIKATRPLSVLMSEKINELRAWAATRTRPAAGDESEDEDSPQSPGTPTTPSMGSPRRPLPERKP
jgi:SpoVK/Ycf46/Vps4 family AAA+-type ATPase